MRPLIVSHTGQPGGSNTVLVDLLRHLPEGVAPRCVFLAPGAVQRRVEAMGFPSEVIEAGRAREVWRLPAAVLRLAGAIRAHRADVVFAHTPKAHLYASMAAALTRTPELWWQHELPGYKRRQHWVAERLPARAVICSSQFTAQMQRRRRPGLEVHRVYPGIEPPALAPHRHTRSADARIASVSRIQRWKRIELLVRAVPGVLEQMPGVHFSVIGSAPEGYEVDYPPTVHAEAARLGVTGAIDFTGHVDDVPERLRATDVMVHTASLEPFGLALVEAMAAGVPVIAPNEGGPAEIVRHSVDGLLVDVEDPAALAGAIVELARDPGRRAQLGEAGRERAASEFSAQRMAEIAWGITARVAASGPARNAPPTGRP